MKIKITRTITIEGGNREQYLQIVQRMETEQTKVEGWELRKEELLNRVTAIKTQEVESL